MSTLKMVFAIMAIVFLGIVVLPYSASLFTGQHTWYELSEGYGSKCVKCHADIYGELSAGGHHKNIVGVDDGEECLICHRANESIIYANASRSRGGEEAHAASTINCGYCHFNSSNPTGAPVAGGFRLSDYYEKYGNDTGANASHYDFVVQSRETGILQNESESCVACHTKANVTIHFNVTTEATIVANNTYNTSHSYWVIEDITASNYTTYKEVKEG